MVALPDPQADFTPLVPAKPTDFDIWKLAADDVMAILIADQNAWQDAVLKYRLTPKLMPTPVLQMGYKAIIELRKQNTPFSAAAFLDLAAPLVDVTQLQKWGANVNSFTREAFRSNLKIVREKGLTAGTVAIMHTAESQIRSGANRKQVTGKLITALSSLDLTSDNQTVTATAISDELDQLFDRHPTPALSTGLVWFDDQFGGLGNNRLWGVVGRYKSRKTTTALNILVGAVMYAHYQNLPIPSIAFFSGEMLVDDISLNIIAMLAVAYIHAHNQQHEHLPGYKIPVDAISGELLAKIGNAYKSKGRIRLEAIDWARQTYREVFAGHVRLYDKREDKGGVVTFANLDTVFQADKIQFGTQLVIVDYLQCFSTGDIRNDRDYDRSEMGSALFRHLTKRYQTTFVVVAQQNEETIKNGGADKSAGVSGGGGFPKAVEYLVESKRYDEGAELPDTDLRWYMRFARYAGRSEYTAQVHPMSGLILSNHWMQSINPVQSQTDLPF